MNLEQRSRVDNRGPNRSVILDTMGCPWYRLVGNPRIQEKQL